MKAAAEVGWPGNDFRDGPIADTGLCVRPRSKLQAETGAALEVIAVTEVMERTVARDLAMSSETR